MQKTSVDLEQRQYDITQSMAQNNDAANQSEAIRDAIEHYAQSIGYVNGKKKDTSLRQGVRRLADALAIVALLWLGLTWFYPVGLRVLALPLFAGTVSLYVFDRILSEWEPNVTRRIRAVVSRGERA